METSKDVVGISAGGRSREDLRSTWGITPGYWLWPTPMKILFVIDGRINLTSDPSSFGLGFVLDTLRAPLSWWVRFEVHVAKRGGTFAAGDLGSHGDLTTFENFRFTQAGFDLDRYHQIWLFGDNPNDQNGPVTDADIAGGFPVDGVELKLVADWMGRGGGVFATGDHSILGASMCSRIPRVRTMRKWRHDQGVPAKSGPARHRTLQPTTETEERQEGDILLQPLEVVFRRTTAGLPFLRPLVPHPVLCSTRGLIDRFPDHMHEGEVFADEEIQLDRPLDIPGHNRPEYPFVVPEILASAPPDVVALKRRPRPHVVAYGRTTNLDFGPVLSEAVGGVHPPLLSKRFGLVSVYDGDSVDLGRVVVDSTWHHWFSFNLAGIEKGDKPAYEKMQAYYRNVGLWLATPAQRASMLISGTWGVLNGSAPMAFDAGTGPWEVGERVLATLELTVSPCMLGGLVAPFLDRAALAMSSAPEELPESDPSWSSLPDELVNRAVVGGIGSALLDLALDHQERRARGQRPRLDPEGIRQRAVDGASLGQTLLKKTVDDAAAGIGAVRASLAASAKPRLTDVRIPIDVRRLRVVAETLQLPDPSDPALIGRPLTLTIQIRLDDSVVAHQILEGVKLPPFEARGSVIDLGCAVGEVEVQTGESLSIEVLVGSRPAAEANPELLRFGDTLSGDASGWIGRRAPTRSQAWRLWYTIEESRPRDTDWPP
jgi:hypothetical protein